MLDLDRPRLDGRAIAVIGLGLMGRPMARNLHAAGAKVTVWNRSPGPLAALAEAGLNAAQSPAEAAAAADTVIVMVSDTAAVETVLTGEAGILSALKPGSLVIDMGTTAVPDTARFADLVRDAGGRWLDAPVSGGEVGATEASLTIMAGGESSDFAEALPLFQTMGRKVTHVGGITAGQVTKAANQVIVGLTIGAVAEGLALARAAGVDPAMVRTALEGGFAWSRVMELHGNRMVTGDFKPGGKVATQRKDMAQGEALADSLGLDLPALRLNRGLYDRLVEAGGDGLDHSALYLLYTDDDPAA